MGIPAFRFAGTWRGYQQRLIDELDRHLDDRRLHVVAAPGAGKNESAAHATQTRNRRSIRRAARRRNIVSQGDTLQIDRTRIHIGVRALGPVRAQHVDAPA